MQIENRQLKFQLSELKIQSEKNADQIVKLQAVLKRYRKIICNLESTDLLTRNSDIQKSSSLISGSVFSESDEERDLKAKDPKENFSKHKQKLTSLQVLIENIKKTPNISKVISLCLKYFLRS